MPVPVTLWHAPQARGPAASQVIVPLPPRPLPWQYIVEQAPVPVVYTPTGFIASNSSSAMLSPSRWPGASSVVGTTWQLEQGIAWRQVEVFRWA